jgi:hypothetical protein
MLEYQIYASVGALFSKIQCAFVLNLVNKCPNTNGLFFLIIICAKFCIMTRCLNFCF